MSRMENWNYYGDPRVQATPADVPKVWIEVESPDGPQEEERELPWRWDVCPLCDGKGSHVNPSIDAGGLSGDDLAEDPDFAEAYFSGRYDQPCNQCKGRSTVPVLDERRCTPEELEAWEIDAQADADIRAEHLAELRFGC